jgi:hypothetical protein
MKKAQISEFIVIVFLIVIIVFFVVMNKLNAMRDNVDKTKLLRTEYLNIYISSGLNKFPYIRINGISIEELMGVYVCYNNETADYGNFTINITKEIRKSLNDIYGGNYWQLEINNTNCLTREEFINNPCSALIDKEYIMYEFTFPLPCKPINSEGKLYIYK